MNVVFIDWHKTLSTSVFWEHRPGCRLLPAELAEVHGFVFGHHELVRDWMLGVTAAEEVCALAARYVGLRTDDVLADLQHSCQNMKLYAPSIVDTLRSMRRRGIGVVIATDNMDTFRRWTVPALRLDTVFDDILTSDARGVLKDDLADEESRFFTPWLADHGVVPSAAVLLDDRRVPAAEAIGMSVRLVADPSKLAGMLAQLA
jgi:FMN phosphatase YigB (HAD superfamily)